MNKKVVVITGSPRKNGNSAAMAEGIYKSSRGKRTYSDKI